MPCSRLRFMPISRRRSPSMTYLPSWIAWTICESCCSVRSFARMLESMFARSRICTHFTAQITFDDIFALLDRVDDLRKLLLGQILCANAGINVRPLQNLLRVGGADHLR